MIRSRFVVRMSRIAVVTAAMFAASSTGSPTVAQTELIPIRLGSVPVESYAEAYYAQEMGYFKRAGLDVKITSFNGGGAITAAVAAGALDIGATNSGSLSSAHVRGLPLVMIAPGGAYTSASPTTVLAVAKSSPIRSAKDLEGKTVAVSTLRDLQQIACMLWIDKNGGDSKKVGFVELPVPQMAPALARGRIDAAMILEPEETQAKDETRVLGKAYDAIAKQLLITGWVANKNWLDRNPEAARRFAGAIRDTADWANRNPDATASILEKFTKIPRETIVSMNRVKYVTKLDFALIQPVIDALAKYGTIAHGFPASELVDPSGPH